MKTFAPRRRVNVALPMCSSTRYGVTEVTRCSRRRQGAAAKSAADARVGMAAVMARAEMAISVRMDMDRSFESGRSSEFPVVPARLGTTSSGRDHLVRRAGSTASNAPRTKRSRSHPCAAGAVAESRRTPLWAALEQKCPACGSLADSVSTMAGETKEQVRGQRRDGAWEEEQQGWADLESVASVTQRG